jgi:hypothetical protein
MKKYSKRTKSRWTAWLGHLERIGEHWLTERELWGEKSWNLDPEEDLK